MISTVLARRRCEAFIKDFVCPGVGEQLLLFLEKLKDSERSSTKRVKERELEEASQILKKIQTEQLQVLESKHQIWLIQLLLYLQMEAVNVSSSACRKLDGMLQLLAQVDQSLVFSEVQQCVQKVLHQEVLSLKDLQIACMFLEESTMGREAVGQAFTPLLSNVTELLPVIMKDEASRNGPLCYQTVKLCLQIFQLLPQHVARSVFLERGDEPNMREILRFLISVILGEVSNRDTRLLAGTAVAMLTSTAPDGQSGAASAWSLLQVSSTGELSESAQRILHTQQWSLTVGHLQVDCLIRGSDGLDRLAVIRGLLTCCRKEILISKGNSKQKVLLLDGIFPLISALHREKLDSHHYVFQVFILWLKSVKRCLPEIWDVTGALLFRKDSNLKETLTEIIWNNAESPVEGLSEAVRCAFALFLEIYEQDCQHSGDTEKQLYEDLLHRIAELPWESKAKYSPLAALLPYVGTDEVLRLYPSLPAHILKCISTNHLAPCASEIYRRLLQEQRRELTVTTTEAPPTELQLATRWGRRWQPVVLKALFSNVMLIQNNASSYLLPCTLRCFPQASDTLLGALDPSVPEHLRAWARVMGAHRAGSGQSPWTSDGRVALKTLQVALSCLDDGVRLAAFNLLCCSPKTKEAPSAVEYAAMEDFLPLNLNSESSPFRQHLQAGVRKFLVRVRDSCMARLRSHRNKRGLDEGAARELERGINFVDWLVQLSLVSLSPSNSFQRKKTALLLLAAVLETCSDSWSPDRKKGQPPANMADLIHWARKREKWDFYSRSRQLVLIGCLEDVTNEIREHASELWLRFFPASVPADVTATLFSRARTLILSPRVPEAQMGALITALLQHKCVPLDGVVPGTLKRDEKESARLIRFLLHSLEQQYLTAKQDMLLAARTAPLHGTVCALQKCVLDVPGVLTDALDRSVTVRMLSALEEITALLLGVLHGDQIGDDEEVLPSFCDMGNAIGSLIGEGGDGGLEREEAENVLLSEEHSLVLTCCWVTLKELGIFLGSLVQRILSVPCKSNPLLTVEDLQRASKVFKDIILKCRHWGAVEGCCSGFTKFCAALLSSSDPELKEIPNLILQQGLCVLKSPRNTSVTRRAAGLPVLILGVLAAEDSGASRPLLARSVNTLLETARAALPHDWDQTRDLPQVCAVHTLQALVKGSSLASSILLYASDITVLSLTLLSSACWAMRNAALQLYSSLCCRMLGQKPAGEEASDQYGMSPSAFFTHYPALRPFLFEALQNAATDLHEARLSLHPSLYPVLTLLAKLQTGAGDGTRSLSDFVAPLLQLAASPVYGVRVMSSRALAAILPPTEYGKLLLRLVEELPGTPASPCCHNRTHGRLLQTQAVLSRTLHADTSCHCSLGAVVEALEARVWLASSDQRCHLLRQAYISVVRLLREKCSRAFLTRLSALLLEELHRIPHALELGSASFHQSAVNYLCEDPEASLQVWSHLSGKSTVAGLSLVKWVKLRPGRRATGLQKVMEEALQINLKEALLDQDPEYKGAYLSALVDVVTPRELGSRALPSGFKGGDLQQCVDLLLLCLEKSRAGPELLAHSLCALSLLISPITDVSVLQRWCSLLESHSRAEAPEALRLACAQSLALTGATVVKSSLSGSTLLTAISTRLISTGVHLLQDQSQQVRAKAAAFASVLCQSQTEDAPKNRFLVHSNQSLLRLLDFLLERLWESEGALSALLCHLTECDIRTVVQGGTLTRFSRMYEQDRPNVYLEPSVIAETVLPYLLRLAKRYPESPGLARHLDQWGQQNAASIREGISVCIKLCSSDRVDLGWLSLLMEPCFHDALRGLFARAAFLIQLHGLSENLQPLIDPSTLAQDLLDLHERLSLRGVFLQKTFIQSLRTGSNAEG